MRCVVQRVKSASVSVAGQLCSSIGGGLLVFAGFTKGDDASHMAYMVDKVTNLRIFEDEDGKMNLSVLDTGGELLVVSQFTLYGDARKGRRPSFDTAMPPVEAEKMYGDFVSMLSGTGCRVGTGKFREMMQVQLVNDGPVTILLDSNRLF